MSHVLVVDDDLGTIETFSIILRRAGFSVTTVQSGHEALDCLRFRIPDLALIDMLLPDISGVTLLARVHTERLPVRVVMMSGFGTIRYAVEALRLGALDFLEKPLLEEQILRTVRDGLAAPVYEGRPNASPLEAGLQIHAAVRWAQAIISVLDASSDPRSLAEWAELANGSRATIENRCRAACVPAKASLDLARMLRALVQAQRFGCRPEVLLELDPRTFHRWSSSARSGPSGHWCSPLQFLETQRFVTDPLMVDVLKREAVKRGIALGEARDD